MGNMFSIYGTKWRVGWLCRRWFPLLHAGLAVSKSHRKPNGRLRGQKKQALGVTNFYSRTTHGAVAYRSRRDLFVKTIGPARIVAELDSPQPAPEGHLTAGDLAGGGFLGIGEGPFVRSGRRPTFAPVFAEGSRGRRHPLFCTYVAGIHDSLCRFFVGEGIRRSGAPGALSCLTQDWSRRPIC